jgi:predicted nucleotidyltransferase
VDGARLRSVRERFGLTQVEVAREAGMHQPVLSAIENGRRGTPQTRQRVHQAIQRLARPSRGLDQHVRAELRQILRDHGATEIRVFGSTARGEDQPGSDLDLLACFPEGFGLLALMTVEEEVEQAFGISVDIVSDDPRVTVVLERARHEAVPL